MNCHLGDKLRQLSIQCNANIAEPTFKRQGAIIQLVWPVRA